ncbi:MAG: hypothetical protein WC007_03575 [Pelobacteraceae bacterium]
MAEYADLLPTGIVDWVIYRVMRDRYVLGGEIMLITHGGDLWTSRQDN